MFLLIFAGLFISSNAHDLVDPKFQVLTPDELMAEVPDYEGATLTIFRIGVRPNDYDWNEVELGEDGISNSRIFIHSQRLNLTKGTTVYYLLVFRDKEGYQAQTGKYVFDGVYYKKAYGRHHRFRRNALSTTEKSKDNTEEDNEEFNPVESRFGFNLQFGNKGPPPNRFIPFGPHHGPPPPNGLPPVGPVDCNDHRHDSCHNGRLNIFRRNILSTTEKSEHSTEQLNPVESRFGFNLQFGPHHGHPPFSPFPPNRPQPFGPPDCYDHRHDSCHNNPANGMWTSSTTTPRPQPVIDVQYHCQICDSFRTTKPEITTTRTTTTTTEGSPGFDIRFED